MCEGVPVVEQTPQTAFAAVHPENRRDEEEDPQSLANEQGKIAEMTPAKPKRMAAAGAVRRMSSAAGATEIWAALGATPLAIMNAMAAGIA